tara:strand:+ start:1512 stop:1706 length:195 start_codon:yes stop_codon:yes gene_type:complete
MKLITLNYDSKTEQVKPKFLKSFNDLPDEIKMDCLIDALYFLENYKLDLHDKMYSENEVVKCQL